MPNSKRSRPTRNGRAIRANQTATPPPVGAFVPARVEGDAPPGATPHPTPADAIVSFAAPVGAPTTPGAPHTPPASVPGPGGVAAGASAPAGPGTQPPAEPPPEPGPAEPPAEPPASSIHISDVLAALGARPAQVYVTAEPSPYIEAGGRISTSHGFFADLYAAGTRGDGEARRRAAQFQAQLRDYISAAANDTASAPQIIPPAWGGAWYVEQIAQMRPAVSAFESASIADNRPIPVPRFKDTTPSSLVGDHVEGQPDAAGTVNFDQVTVTPKPKSGRAEVTRELLDASPDLADRQVSNALRESYAQSTESTMAGVLAAGATAGPAGGATAVAAEQAIRAALGMLPGTRFAPARVILPSSHVWAALVGADGTDGRPLFPYLLNGPTNAAGTTSTGYATGSIAGVETRPAWALDPGQIIVGAGPADAMSFESSLLEFRFAEKSGPELVEFDVWGYFAAVVLQARGVILITSTVAAGDVGDMGARAGNGNGNGSSKSSKS